MTYEEDKHMKIFFAYLDIFVRSKLLPEAIRDLTYHPANGGKRNPREAAKFKKMGVRPGIPDIVLPVPSGKYPSLYIELKPPIVTGVPKPRVSKEQKKKIEQLISFGNDASVQFGYKNTIKKYMDYLGYDESDYKDILK